MSSANTPSRAPAAGLSVPSGASCLGLQTPALAELLASGADFLAPGAPASVWKWVLVAPSRALASLPRGAMSNPGLGSAPGKTPPHLSTRPSPVNAMLTHSQVDVTSAPRNRQVSQVQYAPNQPNKASALKHRSPLSLSHEGNATTGPSDSLSPPPPTSHLLPSPRSTHPIGRYALGRTKQPERTLLKTKAVTFALLTQILVSKASGDMTAFPPGLDCGPRDGVLPGGPGPRCIPPLHHHGSMSVTNTGTPAAPSLQTRHQHAPSACDETGSRHASEGAVSAMSQALWTRQRGRGTRKGGRGRASPAGQGLIRPPHSVSLMAAGGACGVKTTPPPFTK